VKDKLAQGAIDVLSCSKTVSQRARFEKFSERDWQHTIPWLHDTGLALYFLEKLKNVQSTDIIPPAVVASLENSLRANRQRVRRLRPQFDLLNRKFDEAGVMYAAVKGFSLVPEFCPDADLRHQSDFDYVISRESLSRASSILQEIGYSLRALSAHDYLFSLPSGGFRATVQDQYNQDAPCPVELHLSLWGSNARDILLAEPDFRVEHTIQRQWQGVTFRGLCDEIQFLFQVTHLFYHISNYWVRLSWLFEVAHFLKRQSGRTAFWMKVEQLVGEDRVLQEVIALVATLAQVFFAAPVPLPLEGWSLRPAVRVWIDKYSRAWAFGNNQVHRFAFWPSAKLTLFLLQQYAPDQRQFLWSRLFPSRRLNNVARSIKAKPTRILERTFHEHQRLASRTLFHVAANLRYLCERPRWRYLNRVAAHSSAVCI